MSTWTYTVMDTEADQTFPNDLSHILARMFSDQFTKVNQ